MVNFQIKNRKGFSLVEVLLASVIFGIFVATFVSAYLYGEEATMLAGNRARATFLAEEGVEAVRNIRDAGFSNLTDGVHGISTSGNQWSFSGSQDVNGIFTRTVTVAPIDSKRKNVTVNVTWQQNAQRTGTVSLVSRLTNWIIAGIGDWTNPTETGNVNISGNQDGLKIATQGDYVYVIINGGSPDFVVLDISNPDSPVQVGSFVLNGSPVDIEVIGNYAYIASNDNAEELKILDVSNPSAPVKVGVYNAPGNADGYAVDVIGNTAYLVRASSGDNEFIAINVTSKTAPVALGSVNLGDTGNAIRVLGNYAYVASNSNTQELQVINITNPSLPVISATYNIPSNNNAKSMAAFGTTVIVGTLTSGDVRIFDVSTPTNPVQAGLYTAGGNVNDISLGNNDTYAFLATGVNSAEFQVIDISNLSSPSLLGSYNISGNNALNGIAYSAVKDRAYAVGVSNTEEVVVIAPQ